MTKHYCDRCGKETTKLTVKKIPTQPSERNYSDYITEEKEFCSECLSELKKLESVLFPAIINLKIGLYQNFMNK